VIFTFDQTMTLMMNGDQPVYGRAARALGQKCRLLQPVKFLYYTHLFPLEETADDGLPIIFDDEVRYHAGLAGGDPVKLNALMLEYAGVVKRVKALAPSCPVTVYGISPTAVAKDSYTQVQWDTACKPLYDLMDFAFADLSDGSTPPAGFDTYLAGLPALRTQFPSLPIMVKICPEYCTDAEFERRLLAAVSSPFVDQICVWFQGDATWPDVNVKLADFPRGPTLTLNYPDITAKIARAHPGGRQIFKSRGSLSTMTDGAVVQQLNDTCNEINKRQAQLGVLATFWKNAESAAADLMKK
jgi:hypothetical protein